MLKPIKSMKGVKLKSFSRGSFSHVRCEEIAHSSVLNHTHTEVTAVKSMTSGGGSPKVRTLVYHTEH